MGAFLEMLPQQELDRGCGALIEMTRLPELRGIGMDVIALAGETYIDGRESMFRDLPAPDGELAAHWSEHDDRGGLWPQPGRAFDHGRAFNFYTANLERKFGPDWRGRWREETVQRLKAWGFNTIGNWSEPDLWAMHRLPYTVPLWLEGEFWWGGNAGSFSSAVRRGRG